MLFARLKSRARVSGVVGLGKARHGTARFGMEFFLERHEVKNVTFRLTGVSPLILHNDNIAWSDHLSEWRKRHENKNKIVRGDDRSPAFSWIGSLSHDGEHVAIPSNYLSSCLRGAGARMSALGGGRGSMKKDTQTSIMFDAASYPLEVAGGKLIPWAPFEALQAEEDFTAHNAAARANGFLLFAVRAKVGAAKHVRVRPRFDTWALTATATLTDNALEPVFPELLRVAGYYCGLGDWRPSSDKSPGPYGRFKAEILG